MKLVTYDAGSGPRVGVLEDGGVSDVGFDGDMVAFIEAGAPVGERRAAGDDVRLLAPLRPRSLRDFLAFEGHLKGALGRLGRPDSRRVVRAAGLLQGNARHRDRARARRSPGPPGPSGSTTSSSSPA